MAWLCDVVASRFLVVFDHPSAEQRVALWRSALPPRVPLSGEVDFEDSGLSGYTCTARVRVDGTCSESSRNVVCRGLPEHAIKKGARKGAGRALRPQRRRHLLGSLPRGSGSSAPSRRSAAGDAGGARLGMCGGRARAA